MINKMNKLQKSNFRSNWKIKNNKKLKLMTKICINFYIFSKKIKNILLLKRNL